MTARVIQPEPSKVREPKFPYVVCEFGGIFIQKPLYNSQHRYLHQCERYLIISGTGSSLAPSATWNFQDFSCDVHQVSTVSCVIHYRSTGTVQVHCRKVPYFSTYWKVCVFHISAKACLHSLGQFFSISWSRIPPCIFLHSNAETGIYNHSFKFAPLF